MSSSYQDVLTFSTWDATIVYKAQGVYNGVANTFTYESYPVVLDGGVYYTLINPTVHSTAGIHPGAEPGVWQLFGNGGSGGGINSINGNTVSAQILAVSGGLLAVADSGNTHTFSVSNPNLIST